MPSLPRRSVFRDLSVTPTEVRGSARVRVAKQGDAVFELSLLITHEIEAWAARQSPPLTRTAAVAALLWRGIAS